MTEEAPEAAQVATGNPPPQWLSMNASVPQPLPTIVCSHFAFTLSLSEVVMAIGTSRTMMAPVPNAPPVPVMGQEWLQAISMSPQAAQQVIETLKMALVEYRKRFGRIPADPSAKVQIGAPLPSEAPEPKVETA